GASLLRKKGVRRPPSRKGCLTPFFRRASPEPLDLLPQRGIGQPAAAPPTIPPPAVVTSRPSSAQSRRSKRGGFRRDQGKKRCQTPFSARVSDARLGRILRACCRRALRGAAGERRSHPE